MTRRLAIAIAIVSLALASFATPVVADQQGPPAAGSDAAADHLGGAFTVCGRLTAFTAPMPGSDGSVTVAGSVDFTDHTFPIDEAAVVDARVALLAAAGEWTCLDVVGDGMAILTDVAVPAAATLCGTIEGTFGSFVQRHEFTTLALDGDAETVIAADAGLSLVLGGLGNQGPGAAATAACLDFSFAADGTLAAMNVDYAQPLGSDHVAPIACGLVDGTPIPYRDPASQPYPEADTISVDGFEIDAALVEGPYQAVLAFHLDAGLELCLLVRVVDSVIVETAVLTGVINFGRVCGELEVIGGLVFVDTVVVSQTLTTINFAEPTPASIDIACASALAQEAAAAGTLDMCGSLDSIGPTTVTISGITFHLTGNVIAGDVPDIGTVGAFSLVGPHPFEPIDPANPAVVTITTLDGCVGQLPDTALAPASPSLSALVTVLGAVALLGLGLRRRLTTVR